MSLDGLIYLKHTHTHTSKQVPKKPTQITVQAKLELRFFFFLVVVAVKIVSPNKANESFLKISFLIFFVQINSMQSVKYHMSAAFRKMSKYAQI